jgi:hypothetical protein
MADANKAAAAVRAAVVAGATGPVATAGHFAASKASPINPKRYFFIAIIS